MKFFIFSGFGEFLMKGDLGLLGRAGGGGSGTGSMSTAVQEVVSEESSSYPDIELGLRLSLGGGGGGLKSKHTLNRDQGGAPWGQYARILTAKDFPSTGSSSPPSCLSSSSSSSPVNITIPNHSVGTKRTADSSVSPPRANGGSSQVVGWPPVRTYRINSLVNQSKLLVTDEFQSTHEKTQDKDAAVDTSNSVSHKKNKNSNENGQQKTSLFVKVNMDGYPIGRKLDLNAHTNYEALAETLEDMFSRPTTTIGGRRSVMKEHDVMKQARRPASKLLDGSSDFVLTYEDKEGDWMLVGDVPWGMFVSSVQRLRIMRTSDAKGLEPRIEEKDGRRSMRV